MIKSTTKKLVSSAIAIITSISLNIVAVAAGALGLTVISATGAGINTAYAAPVNVVSNGWTLSVPDLVFTSSSWKFVLTPNSPNYFDDLDSVTLKLKDSKGKEIGSGFDFATMAKDPKLEFTLYVDAADFSNIETGNPFIATAEVKRGYGSKQTNLNLTFSVPTTSFPKRPSAFADYIKFATDLTKQELPFPKDCAPYEFKYSINDPFTELSEVDFQLKDATGKTIESDYATSRDPEVQKSEFNICSYSIKDAVAPFTFTTILNFKDSTGKSDLAVTVKVPSNNFPKRPITFSDYITMKTDFATTEIPYPKSCTPFEYQYSINDPYDEISSLDFSLLDGTGKPLASDFDFASETAIQTGSISICDYTIAKAIAPFTLKATIKFSSSTGKPSVEAVIPVKIENPVVKYLTALNAQGVVCVKGSTYSVAKSGKCPTGAKAVNFAEPTDIQWNTLTRAPAQVKGKNFVIFGCVAQFDANTGGSKFRAYASKTPTVSWLSGVNSMFTGNAKSLLKLQENDAFIAKVNVSGATSYSTIGNKTTVPSFAVRDFVKIGSC
jgi:hypothetical protein